jgi:hypothetical protein
MRGLTRKARQGRPRAGSDGRTGLHDEVASAAAAIGIVDSTGRAAWPASRMRTAAGGPGRQSCPRLERGCAMHSQREDERSPAILSLSHLALIEAARNEPGALSVPTRARLDSDVSALGQTIPWPDQTIPWPDQTIP